jgi:hypothetical protein
MACTMLQKSALLGRFCCVIVSLQTFLLSKMNKRKLQSANIDADTLPTKRRETFPTGTPKNEQIVNALSEGPKQCFIKNFPLLTRDAYFIGTYTALLPLLSFVDDVTVYIIEYLFCGIFTADSYNVGGVELIDRAFDASAKPLQDGGHYNLTRIYETAVLPPPIDIIAGKRGLIISIRPVELASKLFPDPTKQLQEWRTCEQAIEALDVESIIGGTCNSMELQGMLRFRLDDVKRNKYYAEEILGCNLDDIVVRKKMLWHSRRCVPLSDKSQHIEIEHRLTSLDSVEMFTRHLRYQLASVHLSIAALEKLRRDIGHSWTRLQGALSSLGLFSDRYNFRRRKQTRRLECLQAHAFRFITDADSWVVGNDDFNVNNTPHAKGIIAQRSRVLKWLVRQAILDPCSSCSMHGWNAICPRN